MRERTAEVYPTLAGVAGFTPKPFICSNVKKVNHGQAVVKRRSINPSLSAQNPATPPPLHRKGVTAKEDDSGRFSLTLDKCFNELSHFVLLVARKVTGFIKNFSQLARWSLPARFARVAPDEEVSGNAENIGQRGQLLRA